MKNWTYNRKTDAWVFGDSNNGGGVFTDESISKKKKTWTGNVVLNGVVTSIGDCETQSQAMQRVEEEFEKIKKQN